MDTKKKKETGLKIKRRVLLAGSKLSPAEENILRLIAMEKTTKQIAEELQLSPKTIENHRGNICKRLGITGTSALLKYAIKMNNQIKIETDTDS